MTQHNGKRLAVVLTAGVILGLVGNGLLMWREQGRMDEQIKTERALRENEIKHLTVITAEIAKDVREIRRWLFGDGPAKR